MAAFRYQLRRFLAFSSNEAKLAGLAPQQYQALLAIKGHAGSEQITVGELAEQLLIRRHTATELVNRMASANLVERVQGAGDNRRVEILMTPKADDILASLATTHLQELRVNGPMIAELVRRVQRED